MKFFASAFVFSISAIGLVPAHADDPAPAVLVERASNTKPGMPDVYVGRVAAVSTVKVEARVEGVLESQKFTDGGLVKKGDVLFQIEKDLYQASADKAEATLDGAKATALERQDQPRPAKAAGGPGRCFAGGLRFSRSGLQG
jgi:membrane fusion protein (multidrug efflux system)